MITLGHFLALGAMLFAMSVIGIFLNRKNLIVLLMAIELMLLAVNMNFVAFSYYLNDMAGQVFVFFILTVAAAVGQVAVELSNTKELGKLLYSQYLYPLEVAAVILLVAIIAAIALTLRQRKVSKYINPSDQIRVKPADRMRLVKMNPTLAAPEPEPAPVAAEEKKA